MLNMAPKGALTVLDDDTFDEAGGLIFFAEALHAETRVRNTQVAWVDVAGRGTGSWLAENTACDFTFIADEDPDFGEGWEFSSQSLPWELRGFGTPSLVRIAGTLLQYEARKNLNPAATVILADAALARPYCDLALDLMDRDGQATHQTALAAIYEWQATALAAFAAMRTAGATVALVGRSEFCWPQVEEHATTVLPTCIGLRNC